jgi:gliding motility-associated-like protein
MNVKNNNQYLAVAFKFRSLCFLFLVLFSFNVKSQSWSWLATAGGGDSDKGLDLSMDRFGNQYACGFYNTPSSGIDVSFGTIIAPSNFGKEGFIAKIDSSGTWLWERHAFGGWDERALGCHVDMINDYVYVTGTAWNSTDFGSCTGTIFPGGSDNIFIGKFDLSGNCQWLLGAGASGDDHGFDMVTDKAGNIYLTGYVSDKYSMGGQTGQFGTLTSPIIPTGDTLAFVTKISPAGTFLWVTTFQGTDGERDNRIAIDTSGNTYVTGGFFDTQPVGPFMATSNGGRDIYVVKLDNSGTIQWLRTAGSTLSDRGNSITVDKYQDIYITGEFRDKLAFGTDSLNNFGGPGGRDIFVAKIDKDGNWKWGKKAGSNGGSDRGNRITHNNAGMLFVTGQVKGNAKFGGHMLYTTDSVQVFAAAIDTSGKWQWVIEAGSGVEDRGNGITADDSCNVYVCGYYEDTATFSAQNVIALGRKDIFVAKIPSSCDYVVSTPPTPEPLPDECYVEVSNVFTPNGDNLNDKFFVQGNCIDQVSFTIFNRWGVEIKNISSTADFWDGTLSNGSKASDGVYYYVGQIIYTNSEIVPIKGFITLAR